MSRITIDALPALTTLTDEQLAELFGRGLSNSRLGVTALEGREMMSVTSIVFSGNELRVGTNNGSTGVRFDHVNPTTIRITETGTNRTWVATGTGSLRFTGGAGHDTVQNNTNLRLIANGGAGNDVLIGGGGNDWLYGEEGNDRLVGRGGSDWLFGQQGNDVLLGLDGGGTGDVLDTGSGQDIAWGDQTGAFQDRVQGATAEDATQFVTGFANGADRTLDGDRIADPLSNKTKQEWYWDWSSFSVKYRTVAADTHRAFGGQLFSSAGPQASDVKQGDLGDCWLLAGVGAIANDNQFAIRRNVVDFGDGTYGVKLGNSFYRVDNDLRVDTGDGSLRGAKLGAENSLWVAIVEKAYTHYRKGVNPGAPSSLNTYASIEGGWGIEVNRAFGSTTSGTADFNAGNAQSVLNQMWARWNNYEALTVAPSSRSSSATGASMLVLNHMYTVMSFTRSASGQVTSITVRNPWGTDGPVTQGANDGLVTLTVAQFAQFNGRFNFGKV